MRTKNINGNMSIIGSNLKKYRELRDLSQRKLSDKLALLGINLYHSDISRIERNKLFIRDFEIKAICKVLNIDPNCLFENTDNFFE